MSHTPDISETRQGMILAQLAGLGVSIARDLEQRACAAKTNEEAVSLAGAFHKVARSVRATLALEMKLVRDQQVLLRDFAADMARRRKEEVATRRNDVRLTVEEAIWREFPEHEAYDELRDVLRELLDEETGLSTFLNEPADVQVQRLKGKLGLTTVSADEEDTRSEADKAADAEELARCEAEVAACADELDPLMPEYWRARSARQLAEKAQRADSS